MSHSSRQKLFVKELRHHLPACMSVWIDEFELLGGMNVETELRAAVESCDYFVVVVDYHAVESGWVQKEVDWALAREVHLGRPFLLPIVLDPGALSTDQASKITERKYLTMPDFTDASIRAIAQELTSEVLQWLSRYFSGNKHVNDGNAPIDTRAAFIARADRILDEVAERIKVEVLPYRESNPLPLGELIDTLSRDGLLETRSSDELTGLLDRLGSLYLLNGIDYDDETIYLSQEQYSYKSSLHTDLKRRLAARAIRMVKSNTAIAIDGGSTTLQLARGITKRIRQGKLRGLTIVTNSVPVAHEVGQALSEIGVGDREDVARIHLFGGTVRPVSLTIVPQRMTDSSEELARQLQDIPTIDVAFLGANGVHGSEAFANHSQYEIPFKRAMVESASRTVMLVDPSKLEIPQERPFAYFNEGLHIITAASPNSLAAIKRFSDMVKETSSTIEVVE
ncbi:TIR domain-containing protein [Gordonia bronchialis]|uniref:TIR domain-containing protein n=1 Tax=Gordonia bronchialis TaxID=2054 RepID=UPI00226F0521|nr:TIR domain-containing protein [Gordonia bronchialis]